MNKVAVYFIIYGAIRVTGLKCQIECPSKDIKLVCAFDIHRRSYTMFPSECAMIGHAHCHKTDFVTTPLNFCIKEIFTATRRVYGESCPVFCPKHYSPVCAASRYRSYVYRTFTNGCHLDMLNCRGDDDYQDYIEVPLHFCQRHAMKNIFKENIIVSDMYDVHEYARKK